jgi:hypothetical protein
MKYTITIALSIAAAKTFAYQPTFREVPMAMSAATERYGCDYRYPNSVPRLCFIPLCHHRRVVGGNAIVTLRMGGYNQYYAESESEEGSDDIQQEIGGRMIDRSKTHMIFGVRCIETKHEISIPATTSTSTTTTETTIVGLQPLNDLEDESSDSTICIDDFGEGKTLSILLDHLLSKQLESDVLQIVPADNDPHHDTVFELVEVGADPIVSLAAAKLLSGGTTSGGSRTDRRVVVRHPDEKRLRVLEHAHLYFNEKTKQNPCTFRTEPLKDDEPFVLQQLPVSTHPSPNSDCVILFTSPALVLSRLEEAIANIAPPAAAYNTDPPKYRVLVPSAIISPEQLVKYDYRVVAGVEETDDDNSSLLLEILSFK